MFPSSDAADEKIGYNHLLASEDGSQSSHSIEESDNDFTRQTKSKNRKLKHYSSLFGKIILVCLALWGVANLGRRTINVSIERSHADAQKRSCSCGGTTVAEAKRRGCIFTPMAIAWLPPHCIDMELSDEFDAAAPGGKWEYWYDLNATIPMTREQMGELADTFGSVMYTTQEWHVMHCMYVLPWHVTETL